MAQIDYTSILTSMTLSSGPKTTPKLLSIPFSDTITSEPIWSGPEGFHRFIDFFSPRAIVSTDSDGNPVIDDSIEIEIEDKDLRIDTYRASGAGGQHVNKTDSAVRLTHVPSGIVVQCQNDRSQHRNRSTAMAMMRARLYELEVKKRESEAQAEQSAKTEIGWGHQIRTYVLHPYQMVKDLRTGIETGNAQGVLDGNLDQFLEASLAGHVNTGKDSNL